jgi:hypothetical protein
VPRDGKSKRHVRVAGFIALVILDGLFFWLAAHRAWSGYQADRGIHGVFRAETCTVQSHAPNITDVGRDQRTTYVYNCHGVFMGNEGQTAHDVGYTAGQQPSLKSPFPADIADTHSATAYAEGGKSYAGFLFLALLLLIPPAAMIGAVFVALVRWRGPRGIRVG